MFGSDEQEPYPVRSFNYLTEQVRANEVQRVTVCTTQNTCPSNWLVTYRDQINVYFENQKLNP